MKPTARKSYGEYKPVIRFPDGSTKICGQSYTYCDVTNKRFHRRGVAFATRDEAIQYARDCIDERRRQWRDLRSAIVRDLKNPASPEHAKRLRRSMERLDAERDALEGWQ